MLQKRTFALINKNNWETLEKEYSNPYEFHKRIRDGSNKVLNELSVLAEKLPEKIQSEVFNRPSLENLLLSILLIQGSRKKRGYNKKSQIEKMDHRRTELAMISLDASLSHFKYIIEVLYPNTPSINRHIIKQLEDCITICKEITDLVENFDNEQQGEKEKLEYLFCWEKISASEGKRLKFLLDIPVDEALFLGNIGHIENIQSKNYLISCNLVSDEEISDEYDFEPIEVEIKLDFPEKNTATISYKHVEGEELIKRLVVKKRNGCHYVYRTKLE